MISDRISVRLFIGLRMGSVGRNYDRIILSE